MTFFSVEFTLVMHRPTLVNEKGYFMGFSCHAEIFIELNSICSSSRREHLITNLFNQYDPLIHKVAWEYPTLEHNLAYSAALKGFMDAIGKYDYSIGVDFAYIAKKYMKSSCQKEYRDNRDIHIPHNVMAQYEIAIKKGLLDKSVNEMSQEELALYKEIEDIIPLEDCVDLDAPVHDTAIYSIGEKVAQNTFDAPDHGYYLSEVENSLKRILEKLPSDEKAALIHFKGLFGEEEKTARKVGDLIGKSHQGAINTLKRAENRLKELVLETEEDIIDTYTLEGIK